MSKGIRAIVAKEFGKTSLCGVRHVGDMRATEDEGGREAGRETRREGGREESPDLSAIRTAVWEAKVPGTAFLYRSLYLRSPVCLLRKEEWMGGKTVLDHSTVAPHSPK